jgi:hypothetical protein
MRFHNKDESINNVYGNHRWLFGNHTKHTDTLCYINDVESGATCSDHSALKGWWNVEKQIHFVIIKKDIH